jgi:hypothetical protein
MLAPGQKKPDCNLQSGVFYGLISLNIYGVSKKKAYQLQGPYEFSINSTYFNIFLFITFFLYRIIYRLKYLRPDIHIR